VFLREGLGHDERLTGSSWPLASKSAPEREPKASDWKDRFGQGFGLNWHLDVIFQPCDPLPLSYTRKPSCLSQALKIVDFRFPTQF
jgi:hypothetical protein